MAYAVGMIGDPSRIHRAEQTTFQACHRRQSMAEAMLNPLFADDDDNGLGVEQRRWVSTSTFPAEKNQPSTSENDDDDADDEADDDTSSLDRGMPRYEHRHRSVSGAFDDLIDDDDDDVIEDNNECVIRIYPPEYFCDRQNVYVNDNGPYHPNTASSVYHYAPRQHHHSHQQPSTTLGRSPSYHNVTMLRRRTAATDRLRDRPNGGLYQYYDPVIEWRHDGYGPRHVENHYHKPLDDEPTTMTAPVPEPAPRKLWMRAKSHHNAKERRSRSQPQHHQVLQPTHLPQRFFESREHPATHDAAERYSIDSETTSSNDSGIRSSTHSTGSSSVSQAAGPDELLVVEAVWDHVAMLSDELPFAQGDLITVVDSTSNSGLWYGMCRDRSGWFPASYVRLRADEAPAPSTANALSDEEFPPAVRYQRRRVVEELIETERDYVKLLDDLVHGFMEQCARRKEMFTAEQVEHIFGNIAAIAVLHGKFLRELEAAVDKQAPENSLVANAFLKNSRAFSIYTEYCNNRPVSCAELSNVEKMSQYRHFFEACRLLRGMSKLTLEGFLLTPVQRICRYPLQLHELLKATPKNHIDRLPLEQAHRTMRAVAAHINDAKRRIDAVQKIMLWQRNVHGFRGPDIVENNHRTLISGELYCRALVKQKNVQWSKPVQVYLFDQSIVLCKRDVLKKNSLVFKERMSLQTTSVMDLHDGKEPSTGISVKNSFKLSGPVREYVFTCPDPATKGIWLDALRNRPRPAPPTDAEKRLALVTL